VGTSGDAERSLQQIAEITSRLFGASTAADVNATFGEANRKVAPTPKTSP
jgi:plasmid stabilization system protein ParE